MTKKFFKTSTLILALSAIPFNSSWGWCLNQTSCPANGIVVQNMISDYKLQIWDSAGQPIAIVPGGGSSCFDPATCGSPTWTFNHLDSSGTPFANQGQTIQMTGKTKVRCNRNVPAGQKDLTIICDAQ